MTMLELYATTDKEKFPCAYPEYEKMREGTTFFADLYVAYATGGAKAIEDTYKRSMKSYKNNVKYLTELVVSLNHLLWMLHDRVGECPSTRLLHDLFYKCRNHCLENFKGDDLDFFSMVID